MAARRVAWVAGVFVIVVSSWLWLNHFHGQRADPLTSPDLTRRKEALAHHPSDETLKTQIRELDLALRQTHARHLRTQALGAWLLFGGAATLLAALTFARGKRKLPKPIKDTDDTARIEAQRGQLATGILAGAIALGAWIWGARSTGSLERFAASAPPTNATAALDAPSSTAPTTPYPEPDELARNWPRFRGPGGLGVSAHTNLSLAWNGASGLGVCWKSPVPLFSPNSPVIWDDRVFLTGASAKRREVYCYDARHGKLLWQQAVEIPASATNDPPTVMEDSGAFAAATAATDGRRVYAIFANGDLAAFDFAGQGVWARNLGHLENHYGHASSLETCRDRLIVQLDQSDGRDNKSKLLAFNSATGEPVWESPPRPVANSWSTPILIHDGQREQIVTTASPWAIAHDPGSGAELWRAKVLTGELTPSAIFAGGFVLTAMESEKLSAIRPDGSGDVTKSHVVWQAEDGLPDITSPLSDGQRVYLVNTYGLVTCYALKDGRKLWEHDFQIGFHASPSLVGDRVLLLNDDGIGVVLAAADTFRELSRSDLGEPVLATPAFADGRVYVRAKQHLFCLDGK